MTEQHNNFVDMRYITQVTSMTDKWFYALIKKGQFPKPTKFGRSSRWLLSDIHQWIEEQQNRGHSDEKNTQM